VPVLTDPRVWLGHLASLIEESRAIRARSRMIREQSQLIHRDVLELREKLRTERNRSAQLLDRSNFPDPFKNC
jgi:hypothetical protein